MELLLANRPPPGSLAPYVPSKGAHAPPPAVPLKTNLDRLFTMYEAFTKLPGPAPTPVFPEGPKNNIFTDKFPPEEVEAFANDSWVLLGKPVLRLLQAFLVAKREHGVEHEKKLYARMTVVELVDRLIKRRPLAFLGAEDSYLLRSGESSSGGYDTVATNSLDNPINLRDYISYDEMQLAALLGVSVHTHFVNTGSRQNRGRPDAPGKFEPSGIYVGLVGARFEREELMEWKHMVITKAQNTNAKGYGRQRKLWAAEALLRPWADFYGMYTDSNGPFFPSYDEVASMSPEQRAKMLIIPVTEGSPDFFFGYVFRRRLRAVLEPFFRDANYRAGLEKKTAYVILVGLGLGVWKLTESQTDMFTDEVALLLEEVALPNIADVCFSYFQSQACGPASNGQVFAKTKAGNPITILFNKSDPAEKLPAEKLLCACYAWDSNSFPGNEYWFGSLTASGDPAAACCSTIPYLQNPYINEAICGTHAVVYGDAREPLAKI